MKKTTTIIVVIGIILLGLIIGYVLLYPRKVYRVGDSSMEPSLPADEVLRIIKCDPAGLKRGQVVIFRLTLPTGEKTISIKRVIGLPNEEIKIEAGQLSVFKKEEDKQVSLDESGYLAPEVRTETRDGGVLLIATGEDEFFVLGDNRSDSLDSRDWGVVKAADIMGRVLGTEDFDALVSYNKKSSAMPRE